MAGVLEILPELEHAPIFLLIRDNEIIRFSDGFLVRILHAATHRRLQETALLATVYFISLRVSRRNSES